MFSSSVRRVASTTTPSVPIASSFASCASRAAAAQALSYRTHQRRYSSSKPSSPADGSKGVAQSGPAAAIAQKGSRGGRKKSKDANVNGKGKEESVDNLPRVPSTQHIAFNRKDHQFHLFLSCQLILCRNIRLGLLFPAPPNLPHPQFPAGCNGRNLCRHFCTAFEIASKALRSHLDPFSDSRKLGYGHRRDKKAQLGQSTRRME